MKFVLFVTLIWSILDSGWSITDEDLVRLEAGLAQIQVLAKEVQDLKKENQAGQIQNQVLLRKVSEVEVENNQMKMEMKQIHELKAENKQMKGEIRQMKQENTHLRLRVDELEKFTPGGHSDQDLVQNMTIEERVTILEGEMVIVQEEVAEVEDDVDGLQDQVNLLFDDQVFQDERLLALEQDTEDLDARVEVLESGGGGGGNVTALEVRLEALEGTAAEHEADIADLDTATSNLDSRVETLEGETNEQDTRLTTAETQIEDLNSTTSALDSRVETLEGETSELETRLTAAETIIEELQATDVELDSRISDLEEGGGGSTNDTIAFRAVMDETDDDDIGIGSTIIFSDVQVNVGNGYDPATGVFTVPSGGEGYYYFATHFTVIFQEFANIDLRVNDVPVCTLLGDTEDGDFDVVGCSTLVFLEEGDAVRNIYWSGMDSTPVYEESNGVYNGFIGFRI